MKNNYFLVVLNIRVSDKELVLLFFLKKVCMFREVAFLR